MKHLIFSCFLLLQASSNLLAQMHEGDATLIGFRGGYVHYSTLDDLRNTVVPRSLQPVIWPHTKELPRAGFSAAVFLHQRIPKWPVVVQLELPYTVLGGDLETDMPDTVFYQNSQFKYRYFNPTVSIHWHPLLHEDNDDNNPFSGIHLGLGFSYNLIVKDDIVFTSHDPSVDEGVNDYMSANLNGKSHFAAIGTIGYEYFWNGGESGAGFGFNVGARIGLGLQDANKVSSFIYEDTDVRTQYLMFTAGIYFPLIR
jgi:hypothetical protein